MGDVPCVVAREVVALEGKIGFFHALMVAVNRTKGGRPGRLESEKTFSCTVYLLSVGCEEDGLDAKERERGTAWFLALLIWLRGLKGGWVDELFGVSGLFVVGGWVEGGRTQPLMGRGAMEIAPVSVCHQVSTMGQRLSPTT